MIRSPRKIMTETDDRAFAALWTAGTSRAEMAIVFGLSGAGSVDSIRTRLGLPARRARAQPRPKAAPAIAEPQGPVIPSLPPHPFWTPERDLAVMATAGRHEAVAALAGQIGRPMVAIRQRWHQLRAA